MRRFLAALPRLGPFLLGLLGALMVYLGYHLYQDHVNHHQMVEWHLQIQRAQAQQTSPQRPVTPPPSVHPSPEQ